MKAIQQLFCAVLFLGFIISSGSVRASNEREFIMSCTYGVLAGTLVGAASLAFVDSPGEHLQYVARGASIGLYMGIGLGLYTVYVLPSKIEKEEEQKLEGETSGEDNYSRIPQFMVFPLVGDNGIDGVGAFWQIARF